MYEIFILRYKYCGSEDEFVFLLVGLRKDVYVKIYLKLDDIEVDYNFVMFFLLEEWFGYYDIFFIDDDVDGYKEYD